MARYSLHGGELSFANRVTVSRTPTLRLAARASRPEPETSVFWVGSRAFVLAEPGDWRYDRVLGLPVNPHSNLTDVSPLVGWYYQPEPEEGVEPVGPFVDRHAAELAAGER